MRRIATAVVGAVVALTLSAPAIAFAAAGPGQGGPTSCPQNLPNNDTLTKICQQVPPLPGSGK